MFEDLFCFVHFPDLLLHVQTAADGCPHDALLPAVLWN